MGIYMITIWYPPHKATDIAKLYLKQPREIPYVTKWRAFNTTGGKDGMKQYHLIYTERGKSEEAGVELNKYYLPFTQIEGFNIQIEGLLGVTDSMKMLGLNW
ncbi:MAG: hypothetical protein ACFFCL_07570 [Promethearchaeota archaeon]